VTNVAPSPVPDQPSPTESLPGNLPAERRPPPRPRIERRLRMGSLFCVIRGRAQREFVLRITGRPVPVSLWAFGIVFLGAVVVSIVMQDRWLLQFGTVLPFDVITGGVLFSSVLFSLVTRRSGGRSNAFLMALAGCAAAVGFTVIAHTAMPAAGVDTAMANALLAADAPADPGRQDLFLHLGIGLCVALALVAEARFRPLGQVSSLAFSALRATPATLVAAVGTLPAALTVLFFIGFVEETWKIFGTLSDLELVAVVFLLLLCVVAVVVGRGLSEASASLERTQSDTTESEQNDDQPPERSGSRYRAAPTLQQDLDSLRSLGDVSGELEGIKGLRLAVIGRWLVHLTITVFLAGFVVAFLMTLITAVAIPESLLIKWLPQDPTEIWSFNAAGMSVYLSWEGLFVGIVLGSFASVVFAGSTLSSKEDLDDLLKSERLRVRQLLELAKAYQWADRQGLWRRAPGATWDTYSSFLADEPMRRDPKVERLGRNWADGTSSIRGRTRYKAEYNTVTGELYTRRWKPLGGVRVLAAPLGKGWPSENRDAIERNLALVRKHLEKWKEHEGKENSLAWLSMQAAELQAELD
jgi:hypothetical protein